MSDTYETTRWITNPYTDEDEEWELEVEFIYHRPLTPIYRAGEPGPEIPGERAHAEIEEIRDKSSGLPIEKAINYWPRSYNELIQEELDDYITDPFRYGR